MNPIVDAARGPFVASDDPNDRTFGQELLDLTLGELGLATREELEPDPELEGTITRIPWRPPQPAQTLPGWVVPVALGVTGIAVVGGIATIAYLASRR